MWLVLLLLIAQSVDYQAEGIKALDAKQYDSAVDLFTKAVAAAPGDYVPHFHLALAYSLLGKDTEAIAQYKTTLELQPGLYEAELNIGISLLRTKNVNGALPYLKAASEKKPNEFRPVSYYAQALLDKAQFSEAEAAFQKAIALNAKSAPAELGLGQAMARQGRLTDAEPHYQKAAALDPAYKSTLLQLAELYEQKHQTAEAIAIYRGFPENPGAQERMGALLSESGHAADGIPALEMAVGKSPTAANRVALAQAYVKNNQPDKAVPLVAQALAAEPDDFELRMYYGRLLRDQRKFPEAVAQFQAAAKLQPKEVKPWNETAGVLIVAEQYPQALAALDRVKALGGETVGHYYMRAISLDHLHILKDALASYKQFLDAAQGKFPDEEFKARQRARIIQNELNKK
ncbi:MAG TPA: tetratricopeptide repeat protein [Bryobacteraceae bacterium]|nr:tetratricopeptide repeat protein [Bryobacteraceae bacterium]